MEQCLHHLSRSHAVEETKLISLSCDAPSLAPGLRNVNLHSTCGTTNHKFVHFDRLWRRLSQDDDGEWTGRKISAPPRTFCNIQVCELNLDTCCGRKRLMEIKTSLISNINAPFVRPKGIRVTGHVLMTTITFRAGFAA